MSENNQTKIEDLGTGSSIIAGIEAYDGCLDASKHMTHLKCALRNDHSIDFSTSIPLLRIQEQTHKSCQDDVISEENVFFLNLQRGIALK